MSITPESGATSSSGNAGAVAGAAVGSSPKRRSNRSSGGNNAPRAVSSPRTSPSYTPGTVQSVRPMQTQANYAARLNAYNTAHKSFMAGLNKGNTAANKTYADMLNKYKGDVAKAKKAAADLYNKNYNTYTGQYGMSKAELAKQHETDIQGLGQDYANRGIGQSSGIYQQAINDYETGYGAKVSNLDKGYNTSVGTEQQNRSKSESAANAAFKTNQSSAAARRSAVLAKNKAKQAAYDKAHPKPQQTGK